MDNELYDWIQNRLILIANRLKEIQDQLNFLSQPNSNVSMEEIISKQNEILSLMVKASAYSEVATKIKELNSK